MAVQNRNYHKLRRLLPELDQFRADDRLQLVAEGREPIEVHVLWRDAQPRLMMTLTRYATARGELVADPEVTLGVFFAQGFVKALSYKDPDRFDRIGRNDLAPQLDDFLSLWLSNLNEQGYCVAPA